MTQPPLQLDLTPNDAQLGKYRLVATLGQGGMGTVYLALASGLGAFRKLLVVKELRRDLPWKENSLAMFMDEAHLAARLDHPNVLQTFEAGEDNGRYYLAMEYLDGQPLSALIDRARHAGDKDSLSLELQIHILCEVLNGLQYAHELRDYDGSLLHVVHRDISPQNVFVTYHGQIKVVDFGVAKASNATNLTSPGVFKGKFAYAAPEQLLGRPVDGRCDVFAVGVMLWEAVAGRRFGEPNPTPASFRTRTSGSEPRIAQIAPEVDPLLAEICDRALAVDPEQRFVSAAALRFRLQEYLALQGERIESAQIADVMRGLFERERRDVHQVIERAMAEAGATRSVIQALPIHVEQLRHDRDITARADLSSLIEVSHESDEQKIRDGYAHSRNAPLPMTQSTRFEPPPWASAALLIALAVGVFVATFQLSRTAGEPEPEASSRPAAKVLTHTVPSSELTPSSPPTAADPRAPTPQLEAKTEVPAASEPYGPNPPRADAHEPEPPPSAASASATTTRDASPSVSSALAAEGGSGRDPLPAKEERTGGRSRRPTPGTSATAHGNDVLRVAPGAGSQRAGDNMGSNLRDTRRSNLRIDVEDPYQ